MAPGLSVDSLEIRRARLEDVAALTALIDRSARALGASDYTPRQIEVALRGTFGVDTELIRDGTYFAVEDSEAAIIACGGWSRRKTLFGGDSGDAREAGVLDPAVDAARIRAFFVDPKVARRGIGRRLLATCEEAAQAAGFTRTELMATLTGVPLYARFGYRAGAPIDHELEPGLVIRFVPMTRLLGK